MKKTFTLPTFFIASLLFLVNFLSGQAFIINSPQEIAGGYEFMAASFGGDVSADVWTADGVFVEDATANPNEGCEAAENADLIDGSIALIDRGSCEFGLKCLNAENAGAIAAIVVNTAPGAGTIAMGAGAVGGQVTIPCIMIPYEVGQLIRAAMNTGQAVNISVGDLEPPPPPANDISVSNNQVLVPRYGILPASQVQDTGDFVFIPGAEIINKGVNVAPNFTIDVTITHNIFGGTPTEVYSESFNSSDPIEVGDTTELILFPEFDPAEIGKGIYNYTYIISMDSVDNASFNNTASGSFTLSDNLYSKGTWNTSTGEPNVTATTSIAGGGDIQFITALDIPYGLGFKIDSVIFDVRNSVGLADIPINVFVYEWNDENDDDILEVEEVMDIRGLAVFTFPDDETENRVVLRLPILDFLSFEETGVIIPDNDMKYLVGIRYEGSETVTFGFDANIDYDRTVRWKEETGTFSDLDLGFIGAQTWDANGIPDEYFVFTDNTVTATGVILNLITDVREPVAGADKFEIKLFPNPVSDQLQVGLTFKEQVSYLEYYAFDAAGRLVLHKRATDIFNNTQARFDTHHLPAGEYHLVVRTDLGIQAKSFIIQH